MLGAAGTGYYFSNVPTGGSTAPDARPEGLESTMLDSPVLIIEDEAMIAWMMESLLEEMGFSDIRIAATGEDALAQVETFTPALIISDINLGRDGVDGVEATSRMRRSNTCPWCSSPPMPARKLASGLPARCPGHTCSASQSTTTNLGAPWSRRSRAAVHTEAEHGRRVDRPHFRTSFNDGVAEPLIPSPQSFDRAHGAAPAAM